MAIFATKHKRRLGAGAAIIVLLAAASAKADEQSLTLGNVKATAQFPCTASLSSLAILHTAKLECADTNGVYRLSTVLFSANRAKSLTPEKILKDMKDKHWRDGSIEVKSASVVKLGLYAGTRHHVREHRGEAREVISYAYIVEGGVVTLAVSASPEKIEAAEIQGFLSSLKLETAK